MQSLPDVLYKYRVWEEPTALQQFNKRILTESELYFPSPNQFNDPFDAGLPFRYKQSEITLEGIKQYLRTLAPHPTISLEEGDRIIEKRWQDGIFQSGAYWKDRHIPFLEKINSTFGVVSLTPDPLNLLMWSHYANSHSGFCVGLSSQVLLDLGHATLIGPVFYETDFPEFMFSDNEMEKIVRLLTTKSTHWEYEKEVRIINHGAPRSTIKLPAEAYKELIIGSRCSKENTEELIALAKSRFPCVRIFQAKLHEEKFDLVLEATD